MDIQKLTENYRKRFDAFYGPDPTEKSGRKKKKRPERPNYLCEVIRPVLDALVDLMPEYGFVKTTDKYAMFGEYYRIKAGIVLIGGFSVDEDFRLIFTPLFHGVRRGVEDNRFAAAGRGAAEGVREKEGENENVELCG